MIWVFVFDGFSKIHKILTIFIQKNMTTINLHHKTFQALSNSDNGEVSASTRFEYRQEGKMIWATYGGGSIVKGHLLGQWVEDHLEFVYHHINEAREVMTGKCTSHPERRATDGKILLKESWEWTCGDCSRGESVLVEV